MILLLFACRGLAPSQDLAADEDRLATLPSDVTVIGSLDAAALRGTPFATRLDGLGTLGVTAADVDHVVLGCGDDGCAALAEGRFAEGIALDESTSMGRIAGRRLDASRLVVGDRSALRRIALDATEGVDGLDVASLEGRIPAGEAWILLRDPDILTDQAATRLERAPLWADVGADLREAWAAQGARLDGIDSIAVSADTQSSTLRARAVCDSEDIARKLLLEIRAASALSPGHPVAQGDFLREGAVIEWSREVDEATLDAWGAR